MKTVIAFGFVILLVMAACSIPASTAREVFFASWPGVEGSFDRSLNVSGTVDLEVLTGSGSIEVRPGSGDRVQIHGRIRAGDNWWRSSRDTEDTVRRIEANPPIEQSGQRIRVGQNGDRDWYRN